jgi:hypothetical protein
MCDQKFVDFITSRQVIFVDVIVVIAFIVGDINTFFWGFGDFSTLFCVCCCAL